jgi:amino acid transporter/mannitol/fructose-specific phosphotransferase system IIA component (Ntr-type)
LERRLGALDVFCIAAGAMISSGLFVLPSIVFARTGASAILAYFLAGLVMVPGMLAKLELATAMPRSGGTYFFIERSLGALPGTFGGLANWFAISLKGAFALVGIGIFAGIVIPDITGGQIRAIACFFCVLFAVTNLLSVKGTGRLQIFLVAGLLAGLAWFIIAGIQHVSHERLSPFMTTGWRGLFAATGMVFISYGGLTKVADVAEEVRKSGRAIPLGMVSGFVVVQLIYVLAVFVTVGGMDSAPLSKSLRPISDVALKFSGKGGEVVMALAGLLAFLTTANAALLSASRSPMAMSRDGLLPAAFQRVSRRFGTPHLAILLTALFMLAVLLFLDVESLVKTASTLMLILFIMENLSLVVMRASRVPTYRPTFRVPLYPWLQMAAILVYTFLIVEMGRVPLTIAASFALLGAAWYVAYGRRKTRRRSALVRLVMRITAREIAGSGLSTELQTLLRERDDIVEDRFDRLIRDAAIIDLPEAVGMEEFFDRAAGILAERMDLHREAVFAMLRAREAESSTVVSPGLAIPHLIVEGRGKFDILVARCRQGIAFEHAEGPVKLVFVLAGSRDERPFHLRTLMGIAQMARKPRFEEHCLRADNVEEIRNILLVAERRREGA